jgi:DedD protein
MERALQERVIGAVVLVLFAILIVPIFLDGPADEAEIKSESVTLPGQNNQKRKQQTIVLERNRSEPVPAAESPGTSPTTGGDRPATAQKQAAVLPAAEEPKAMPSVAAKTATNTKAPAAPPVESSTTGMWAVQLGSFSSQENAERLAADLRKQGYAAFLSQLYTTDGALHRVRVGPQKDRDSAESVAAQLTKGGHNGQVVPHP